jgi:dTDP-4-amino-4,6-dideoxygalactose transaminase
MRVLDSGKLTGFMGNFGPAFYGGKEVRSLEEEWCAKFNVRHSIACNSATSGLHIACGAVGMDDASAGDAIVSPFSMTCSATAPMYWRQGVRFADIERDYYCISADSVRDHIKGSFAKFSAVIPVSLFGQPYDADAFRTMLKVNEDLTGKKIYVIEDAAQALGSTLNGKYAGTLGDIGVYSFNLGKHLTAGEGGMIVTDDDELAFRCRLLMNHAEAVVNDMDRKNAPEYDATKYARLYGFNLRLPEISAAIVRVQLAKHDELLRLRTDNVNYLVNKLKDIPYLEMPKVREGCTHSYYVLPLKYVYDENYGPISHRDKYITAVKAELQPVKDRESEGVTVGTGYIRPISAMPLFGRSMDETPECKRQYMDELIIIHRMFGPNASHRDLNDIANAFEKCWENRAELC